MEIVLEKEPQILILKSKFFFYRIISYFSFLFIPIYTQKLFISTSWLKFSMMLFYLCFLIGQWFLIGKEIDYRLKIFFKVNSNMDRVLYRTIMGLVVFIFYANIINLLPYKWIYNLYWVTWVLIGVFFSWPTRGKIIKESVTSNFTEFKFLDSFEKTTLALIIIILFFSIPRMASLSDVNKMVMTYDPNFAFSPILWNFFKVIFFPFQVRPQIFIIGVSMHFYFIFQVIFLLTFYALLRFFFSRRLSLLGVFAVVSSWGFSSLLYNEPGASLSMIFPMIWIWSMLWVAKSSSYKTGLFLGLINCFGVIINPFFIYLILLQIPLFLWGIFNGQTNWFRRQFIKYSIPGYLLSVGVFYFKDKSVVKFLPVDIFKEILFHFQEKAFLSLSLLGIVLFMITFFKKNTFFFRDFYFDRKRFLEMGLLSLAFLIPSVFLSHMGNLWFLIICLMVFLSLIPLELLFQKTSRFRSSRNIIFAIYLLICLLDSHFEGRVKIFLKMFE